MEPTTKKLRPYQVRLVTDVCRATEDILVEPPTGSGKTVQIVTLVAMHLGRRFTHALISAPQEQIEQGFVKRDYQAMWRDEQRAAIAVYGKVLNAFRHHGVWRVDSRPADRYSVRVLNAFRHHGVWRIVASGWKC